MEKNVHGGDIYSNRCKIDFSASVSPLALPESVREAACRAFDRCSAYPDPECRELRRALACKEGVPEEQIVCGNGASDLIYAVTRAVHPRKALLYTPSFSEYETALSLEGSEISWYSCRSGNEFTLDEGFIEAITEDIDMVFVCNPGNPTGTAVPTQILKKIAERCAAAGCVLVSDECFVAEKLSFQDAGAFYHSFADEGISAGGNENRVRSVLRFPIIAGGPRTDAAMECLSAGTGDGYSYCTGAGV